MTKEQLITYYEENEDKFPEFFGMEIKPTRPVSITCPLWKKDLGTDTLTSESCGCVWVYVERGSLMVVFEGVDAPFEDMSIADQEEILQCAENQIRATNDK